MVAKWYIHIQTIIHILNQVDNLFEVLHHQIYSEYHPLYHSCRHWQIVERINGQLHVSAAHLVSLLVILT